MTKREFLKQIKTILKNKGYRSISINPSLFGLKADISCKNTRGKKANLKAYVVKVNGYEVIQFEKKKDLDWIDEWEAWDELFDDC